MNKWITVKKLYDACKKILMQHGDKQIFVAVDDEWNDYRPLYFEFLTNEKEIRECDESAQSCIPNYWFKYNEVVILW